MRKLVKEFSLIGVAKSSPTNVGPRRPSTRHSSGFLGYSRGSRVSNRRFPMPQASAGTASWVRALSEVYDKLVENRDKVAPHEERFGEAIDDRDGFGPAAAGTTGRNGPPTATVLRDFA